jgi:hypothetical protein
VGSWPARRCEMPIGSKDCRVVWSRPRSKRGLERADSDGVLAVRRRNKCACIGRLEPRDRARSRASPERKRSLFEPLLAHGWSGEDSNRSYMYLATLFRCGNWRSPQRRPVHTRSEEFGSQARTRHPVHRAIQHMDAGSSARLPKVSGRCRCTRGLTVRGYD